MGPPLPLRPLPPADGRGNRPPGETGTGRTGPSFQGVSGAAQSAGIGRVTLDRLENGEQTPLYRTLEGISESSGRPVRDLVSAEELIQ